jgi:hypothetical protein
VAAFTSSLSDAILPTHSLHRFVWGGAPGTQDSEKKEVRSYASLRRSFCLRRCTGAVKPAKSAALESA